MMGAELWRRKSDRDILDAVARFDEYTEVGQAILREEMQRRGLGAVDHPAGTAPADEPPVVAQPVSGPHLRFFEVGTQKFVVMSLCTFGGYSLYWFYENWKRIRAAKGPAERPRAAVVLSAFMRTLFAPLWAYAMFRDVRNAALAARVAVPWRPWVLAIGYVLANLCYRLPNQAAFLSLLGVLFLLPVQQVIQRMNRAPGDAGQNAGYTAANIAWMILGVSYMLVALLSRSPAPPR
jgi:hypothetical protein